jgi:phosphoribosyl 1,2-cyclic phosphodiesterase
MTFWGTRGSLATPGPETVGYGGNTSCVEVRNDAGDLVVLDAGTGIRRLGSLVPPDVARIDILLSHLHMDHIQGLGFFAPLRDGTEVHIWGPASTTMSLRARLSRYLSPPLFPVRLRDLPAAVEVHDVPLGTFAIPGYLVTANLVCHPGPTVGYRIEADGATLAYLPDHEPALGANRARRGAAWTSGYDLAADVDVLVHDSQFSDDAYRAHVGWGHSSTSDAARFAVLTRARTLVPFHYDPSHDDAMREHLHRSVRRQLPSTIALLEAREGQTITVPPRPVPTPAAADQAAAPRARGA